MLTATFQQPAAAMAFQQPAAGWVRPPQQGIAGQIATMVIDDVKQAARRHPRHLQAALGPSEIGTPCMRQLAYKILAWDRVNNDTDPWASILGIATHAWMADVYDHYETENRRLGRSRYLVEHRVTIPGVLSGSTDLYDRDVAAVIDWKLIGLPKIKQYRAHGPGRQYRIQAHTYGLGLLIAGEKPEHVADVFLPRGGRIDDLYVWSEPFDPQIAIDAINAYQSARDAVISLDPEANPAMWAMFPTGDAHCTYCPFYLPRSADLSKGCPGHKTIRPNS